MKKTLGIAVLSLSLIAGSALGISKYDLFSASKSEISGREIASARPGNPISIQAANLMDQYNYVATLIDAHIANACEGDCPPEVRKHFERLCKADRSGSSVMGRVLARTAKLQRDLRSASDPEEAQQLEYSKPILAQFCRDDRHADRASQSAKNQSARAEKIGVAYSH